MKGEVPRLALYGCNNLNIVDVSDTGLYGTVTVQAEYDDDEEDIDMPINEGYD